MTGSVTIELVQGNIEMMLVVENISLQLDGCTNGVMSARGDAVIAEPVKIDVASDMTRSGKKVLELLCQNPQKDQMLLCDDM